jgi:hypothetical protein
MSGFEQSEMSAPPASVDRTAPDKDRLHHHLSSIECGHAVDKRRLGDVFHREAVKREALAPDMIPYHPAH